MGPSTTEIRRWQCFHSQWFRAVERRRDSGLSTALIVEAQRGQANAFVQQWIWRFGNLMDLEVL